MDPTPLHQGTNAVAQVPRQRSVITRSHVQCHFRAQRENFFFDPKKLRPGQTGSFLKIPNLSPSLATNLSKKKKIAKKKLHKKPPLSPPPTRGTKTYTQQKHPPPPPTFPHSIPPLLCNMVGYLAHNEAEQSRRVSPPRGRQSGPVSYEAVLHRVVTEQGTQRQLVQGLEKQYRGGMDLLHYLMGIGTHEGSERTAIIRSEARDRNSIWMLSLAPPRRRPRPSTSPVRSPPVQPGPRRTLLVSPSIEDPLPPPTRANIQQLYVLSRDERLARNVVGSAEKGERELLLLKGVGERRRFSSARKAGANYTRSIGRVNEVMETPVSVHDGVVVDADEVSSRLYTTKLRNIRSRSAEHTPQFEVAEYLSPVRQRYDNTHNTTFSKHRHLAPIEQPHHNTISPPRHPIPLETNSIVPMLSPTRSHASAPASIPPLKEEKEEVSYDALNLVSPLRGGGEIGWWGGVAAQSSLPPPPPPPCPTSRSKSQPLPVQVGEYRATQLVYQENIIGGVHPGYTPPTQIPLPAQRGEEEGVLQKQRLFENGVGGNPITASSSEMQRTTVWVSPTRGREREIERPFLKEEFSQFEYGSEKMNDLQGGAMEEMYQGFSQVEKEKEKQEEEERKMTTQHQNHHLSPQRSPAPPAAPTVHNPGLTPPIITSPLPLPASVLPTNPHPIDPPLSDTPSEDARTLRVSPPRPWREEGTSTTVRPHEIISPARGVKAERAGRVCSAELPLPPTAGRVRLSPLASPVEVEGLPEYSGRLELPEYTKPRYSPVREVGGGGAAGRAGGSSGVGVASGGVSPPRRGASPHSFVSPTPPEYASPMRVRGGGSVGGDVRMQTVSGVEGEEEEEGGCVDASAREQRLRYEEDRCALQRAMFEVKEQEVCVVCLIFLIKQLVVNSKKIGGSAAGQTKRIEKNRSLLVFFEYSINHNNRTSV